MAGTVTQAHVKRGPVGCVTLTIGANRSTSATEKVAIVFSGTSVHTPVAVSDVLTFKLANNIVNAAALVAKLYYEGTGEGG